MDKLNFKPLFKEKDNKHPQYEFLKGEWVECSEFRIDELYGQWILHPLGKRFYDDENFLIYGYETII